MGTDGEKPFEPDGTEVKTHEVNPGKLVLGESTTTQPDATAVEVNLTSEGVSIVKKHDIKWRLWTDVTEQSEIEKAFLEQNKRHLQQV